MKTEYHKIYSKQLGENFEFKIYGQHGKPVMVFPSSCGRFYDFEDRNMIKAIAPFIEGHDIQVICIDSRDGRSWFKEPKDHFMGINHRQFELCITSEIVPWLKKYIGINEKFITTWVSWGGYHALNFAFKFPDIFDTAISLSGAYSLHMIIGNYYDDHVYYNDILKYMPQLLDPAILNKLRQNYFFIVHGKGSWEQCNHDAWELAQILGKHKIPHHYSAWSELFPHDWNSWLSQLPYYMDMMKKGVSEKDGKQYSLIGPDRRMRNLI